MQCNSAISPCLGRGPCVIQWGSDFHRGVCFYLLQAPMKGWVLSALVQMGEGGPTSVFHKYLLSI